MYPAVHYSSPDVYRSRRILVHSYLRGDAIESKVDALGYNMAYLTLLVRQKSEVVQAESLNGDERPRVYFFCRMEGHTSKGCEKSPYRASKCERCGKRGN